MTSMPDSQRWQLRYFTSWSAQAFSMFGSSLTQFALVWWLTKTTGSATTLAACRRDRFCSLFRPTLDAKMVNNNILQPILAPKQAQNSDDGPYSDRLLADRFSSLPLAESTSAVQCIVRTLLQEQFLGGLTARHDASYRMAWSDDVAPGEPVEALYDGFANFAGQLAREPVSSLPELRLMTNSSGEVYLQSMGTNGELDERPLGTTGLWFDGMKEAVQECAPFDDTPMRIAPHIWSAMVNAGGWTTERPGGGNLHS